LAEERRRNIDAFDTDREKEIGQWYTKKEEKEKQFELFR